MICDGPKFASYTIGDGFVRVRFSDVAGGLQVRPSGDYAELRYANPVCNLFNSEGLPAWPFRTDDWPGFTYGKL